MNPKNYLLFLPLVALWNQATAAPVTKDIAGTDLTVGTSWVGGNPPSGSDVATWSGTALGAGLTLATSQSWQGIDVQGAAGAIDITGAGTLTLDTAGINIAAAGQNLTIVSSRTFGASSSLNVGTGRTLTLGGATASTTVFGAGTTITLTGAGTMTLGGAAAHTVTGSGNFIIGTGSTLINNFQVGSSSAGFSGTVTLSAGGSYYQGTTLPALGTGVLNINGGTIGSNTGSGARSVTNPTLIGGDFTLANTGGSTSVTTFSGAMDLGGATRTITTNLTTGQGGVLSGVISNGGLTIGSGSTGFLTLSSANTFTGPTTVNSSGAVGGLAVANNSLASSSSVTLNGLSRMFLGVNGPTSINNLNGATGTAIRTDFTITGGTGSRFLQVNQTVDGVYAGTFTEGSGRPISLIKTGAAVLSLTNTATYTGATTVNQGTLQIGNAGTGSTGASSTVTVAAAGALAGTGTANGPVTINGTLRPGDSGGGSAGTFKTGGPLALNAGSALDYNLGAVGGPSNDLTTSVGAATIAGTTTLNITAGSGFDTVTNGGGIYTLVDSAASIIGSPSNVSVGSGVPVNNAYVITTNATDATLNLALIEHAESSWSAASDLDSGSTDFGTFNTNTAGGLDTQNVISLNLSSPVAALLDGSAGGSLSGDVSLFSVSAFAGFNDLADGSTGGSVTASFLGAPAPGTYSVTLTLPKSLFTDDASAFTGLAGHTLGAPGGLDSTGDTQSGNLTWTWSATVVPEPSSASILAVAALLGLRRRRCS